MSTGQQAGAQSTVAQPGTKARAVRGGQRFSRRFACPQLRGCCGAWRRYYFYGVQAGSHLACLVEMVVSTTEHVAAVTFRSELPAGATMQFVELFKNCLLAFA